MKAKWSSIFSSASISTSQIINFWRPQGISTLGGMKVKSLRVYISAGLPSFLRLNMERSILLAKKVNPSPLFAPKVKIETMQGHYLYGNTAASLFVYKEIMQGHKQKS